MSMRTGKFYGNIILSGEIDLITGMHIGGSENISEVGGVDNPVLRDPISNEPYIPGSSIKGKMRSLLEQSEAAKKNGDEYFNRNSATDKRPVRRHECMEPECIVCRIFGATDKENSRPSRISVSDAFLINKDEIELDSMERYLTEIKYENTLDRITSAATPRQMERVPRGAKFGFTITYTVDQDMKEDGEEVKEDIKTIIGLLKLLQDEGLGGSVSRGYGRLRIKGLKTEVRLSNYYFGNTPVKEVEIPDMDTADVDEIIRYFE
ncbi:type III-A CRISPR-associated RAMP protein Csm3 [Calorimonas adulescens]|nr:type III-A CRISPR-associated RAMP protein Csm3 [Calorimonas adulescens]